LEAIMTISSNSADIVLAAEQLQGDLRRAMPKPVLTSSLLAIVNLVVEISKKQQDIEARLVALENSKLLL
jgi:hypothetical protein